MHILAECTIAFLYLPDALETRPCRGASVGARGAPGAQIGAHAAPECAAHRCGQSSLHFAALLHARDALRQAPSRAHWVLYVGPTWRDFIQIFMLLSKLCVFGLKSFHPTTAAQAVPSLLLPLNIFNVLTHIKAASCFLFYFAIFLPPNVPIRPFCAN